MRLRTDIVEQRLVRQIRLLEEALATLSSQMAKMELSAPQETDDQPREAPEIYATLVRLAEHGQQNKWQTLHMFLVFQTILFLCWTSLYTKPHTNPLLLGIGAVGLISGLVWSRLGADYADASRLFSDLAEEYENRFPPRFRPLSRRKQQINDKVDRRFGRFATSSFLVTRIPLTVFLLYGALEVLVAWKWIVVGVRWMGATNWITGGGRTMNGQLTPLTIGFVLGIIGSLAAAIFYDRATRPKLTALPDKNRAQSQTPGQAPHEFYHLLVRQVPPRWPFPGRRPAWDCKITLDVIDGAGASMLSDGPVFCRWASQPEPLIPALVDNKLINIIDFARLLFARKANVHSHEDQPVSVALKYDGSPDCFLFSNESYLFPLWEKPTWRLGLGDHRLRVTIDYERGREVRYFNLRNLGNSRSDVLLEPAPPA